MLQLRGKKFNSLDYRALDDTEMIAQFGQFHGLAYGVDVTLRVERDLNPDWYDYPAEYTVVGHISGQDHEELYRGGDLVKAVEIYGQAVLSVA